MKSGFDQTKCHNLSTITSIEHFKLISCLSLSEIASSFKNHVFVHSTNALSVSFSNYKKYKQQV